DCPQGVEDCIRYQGRPDERRRVSPDEEHLIYRGPKTLYRGTGEANTAVGPEWKEYVVRGGQIVEGFAAVQVMEAGYPWLAEAGAEQHCEAYGHRNTKSCGDITPLGAVPARPKQTEKPFDYGCQPGAPEPRGGSRGITPTDPDAFRVVVGKELHAV